MCPNQAPVMVQQPVGVMGAAMAPPVVMAAPMGAGYAMQGQQLYASALMQ